MPELADVDILLTDIAMPGMDGLTSADKLLKMCPKLPVVFKSGHSDYAVSHQAKLSSDTIILPKPFRFSDLSAAFLKVINSTQ